MRHYPQFPAELMRPEGAPGVGGAVALREGEQLAQFLGVAVPKRPLEHRHVLILMGPFWSSARHGPDCEELEVVWPTLSDYGWSLGWPCFFWYSGSCVLRPVVSC